MANFVTNNLTISADGNKLNEILEAIRANDAPLGSFDFNKLIPMPEALDVTDGSITDIAISIYIYDLNRKFSSSGQDQAVREEFSNAVLSAKEIARGNFISGINYFMTEDNVAKTVEHTSTYMDMNYDGLVAMGKQYIENQQNYGAHTWYRWCKKYWGTKGTPDESSRLNPDDDHSLIFDTAWSMPEPVIQALSSKFPEVKFTISWSDEDMGYNVGTQTWLSGVKEYEYIPEPGSAKAYDMAFEIHGTCAEDHYLCYDEATDTYVFDEERELREFEARKSLDGMIASAEEKRQQQPAPEITAPQVDIER